MRAQPDAAASAAPLLADGAIAAVVSSLPALPAVVNQLFKALDDDDVNAEKMSGIIGSDQVLAAKTLRLANSSFYGMRREICTIHESLAIIGFNGIRNLVAAIAVTGQFRAAPGLRADVGRFWHHAITVALGARALAGLKDSCNEDDAFMAGLLHDIGKLVLLIYMPERYRDIMAASDAHAIPLVAAEMKALGTDHAVIGATLARKWNFPSHIVDAIQAHHAPPPHAPDHLATLIRAADLMAHEMIGHSDGHPPGAAVFAAGHLMLAAGRVDGAADTTAAQVEELCRALGV